MTFLQSFALSIVFALPVGGEDSRAHLETSEFSWPDSLQYKDKLCRDLEIGEHFVVEPSSSPHRNASYLLGRLDTMTYRIGLPLYFEPSIRMKSKMGRRGIPGFLTEYRKRVKKCFAEAKPFLFDSRGFRLVLSLVKRIEVRFQPLSWTKIRIVDTSVRENSHKWNHNSSCATIVHETMHLLGLVDEYEEKNRGWNQSKNGDLREVERNAKIPKYDCRTLGPDRSIMNDSFSIDWVYLGEYVHKNCNCLGAAAVSRENYEKCIQNLAGFKNMVDPCPPLSHEHFWFLDFSQISDLLEQYLGVSVTTEEDLKKYFRVIGHHEMVKNYSVAVAIGRTVDFPSLIEPILRPAHLRAIIYPGCDRRNSVYYSCGRNAYRSSQEGDGCIPDEELPASCSDGGFDWLE